MDFYNDIDPYCCEVLRGRITEGQLPMGAVSSRDIRCLTAADLRPYRQVHLFAGIGGMALGLRLAGFTGRILTAGFPCQDISQAGRGRGLDGERSGLWWETLAAIDLVRPPLVLLENVAALLARGLDAVLGGLAEVGYDAQWHCVQASFCGAPQARDRVWIVAHPDGRGRETEPKLQQQQPVDIRWADHDRLAVSQHRAGDALSWVRRADNGLPHRVDRLRALGNAVVPQVVAYVAKAVIMPACTPPSHNI